MGPQRGDRPGVHLLGSPSKGRDPRKAPTTGNRGAYGRRTILGPPGHHIGSAYPWGLASGLPTLAPFPTIPPPEPGRQSSEKADRLPFWDLILQLLRWLGPWEAPAFAARCWRAIRGPKGKRHRTACPKRALLDMAGPCRHLAWGGIERSDPPVEALTGARSEGQIPSLGFASDKKVVMLWLGTSQAAETKIRGAERAGATRVRQTSMRSCASFKNA